MLTLDQMKVAVRVVGVEDEFEDLERAPASVGGTEVWGREENRLSSRNETRPVSTKLTLAMTIERS